MEGDDRNGLPFTYVQGAWEDYLYPMLARKTRAVTDIRDERPRCSIPLHHAESTGSFRLLLHFHRITLPPIRPADASGRSPGLEGELTGRASCKRTDISYWIRVWSASTWSCLSIYEARIFRRKSTLSPVGYCASLPSAGQTKLPVKRR